MVKMYKTCSTGSSYCRLRKDEQYEYKPGNHEELLSIIFPEEKNTIKALNDIILELELLEKEKMFYTNKGEKVPDILYNDIKDVERLYEYHKDLLLKR